MRACDAERTRFTGQHADKETQYLRGCFSRGNNSNYRRFREDPERAHFAVEVLGASQRETERVAVAGERISLDLTDCDIDLQRLLDVGVAYGKANGVLTAEQLTAIEFAVSDADGVFLPNWDDLEQHVNGARGGAGEVIADLRRRVEDARSSLLRSLGEGYLAHANPEAAIGALERALEHIPDDESVARSLVAACLRSGRLARAEQLRKEFSLV